MNAWLWAATILVAAILPLALVAVRRPPDEGFVALEVAGTAATLALLLIAEGTHRQGFVDLALALGALSFVGAIAFIRFLGQPR